MDLLSGILMYAVPLVGFAFLLSRADLDRGIKATLLFGTPAVGCLSYVLWQRANGIDLNYSIWHEFAFFYPFVVLPFGLWALWLGLIAALIISHAGFRTAEAPLLFATEGALFGSVVGAVFLGVYALAMNGGVMSSQLFWAWVVAGAVAGGVSGSVVVASQLNVGIVERSD